MHVSDALLDYLQQVLKFTRNAQRFELGLSPRAGLALRQCAQGWAYVHGRDHVLPEDKKYSLIPRWMTVLQLLCVAAG